MSGAFRRLDDTAVVLVSGTAARGFLARQLTCDVAALTPEHPLFGAWLTPKGRALTLVHLVDRGDGRVRMLMPAELAGGVMKRLGLFIMRDDVQLRLLEDEAVFGLAGEAISEASAASSPLALARLPAPDLALGLCPQERSDGVEAHLLAAGCTVLSMEGWNLLQIRAGLPRVVAATQEAFVPQMINLDLLDAISFEKGCYPGQEIVARTQHLGRIKRRAYIGHCDAATPRAAPGDVLVSRPGGDAAGRVVLAANHDGGQELLAVVALESADRDEVLHLGTVDGPQVRITAPDYL